MPESNRQRRKNLWLVWAVLILAALLGSLMLKKYAARHPPETPAPPAVVQEGVRPVTLFFASPERAGLVRESREIGPCENALSCAEALLEELINGPLGDLSPTLPETATFNGVTLEGDMMSVDFGRELQDGIVSGSNSEMMAVYSVVNSLVLNFPQIRKVRFLVEGKTVETLKGHIDLREPLTPDFQLEKKEPVSPGEQAPSRSVR